MVVDSVGTRDLVHNVFSIAFAFAFAFLAFVVGYTALFRFLDQQSLGHMTNTFAHEATPLLSVSFALPLVRVAIAFLRQGTGLQKSVPTCECPRAIRPLRSHRP